MCITIVSTAHPSYPLILINNRDEFLERPTAVAHWWNSPDAHVLGGRDQQREAQGTWLGITKQGRLASLTNYREEGQAGVSGTKSRGAIVNAFLQTPNDSTEQPEQFAKRLVEEVGVHDVGGFSLVFGQLKAPKPDGRRDGLAIVSNRTLDARGINYIAQTHGQIHGISNSHFGDLTWPKVVHGEALLRQLIHSHTVRESTEEDLIIRLFDLLSIDTLPRMQQGEDWNNYIRQLRNSIFVPKIGGPQETNGQPADGIASANPNQVNGNSTTHNTYNNNQNTATASNGPSGAYGTQKQTVILVDNQGHVTFIEKTLYDHNAQPTREPENTRAYYFDIDGWWD